MDLFSVVFLSLRKNLLQAKLQLRIFAQKLIGFPNTALQLVHSGCKLSGKEELSPPLPFFLFAGLLYVLLPQTKGFGN